MLELSYRYVGVLSYAKCCGVLLLNPCTYSYVLVKVGILSEAIFISEVKCFLKAFSLWKALLQEMFAETEFYILLLHNVPSPAVTVSSSLEELRKIARTSAMIADLRTESLTPKQSECEPG